MPSIDPQESLVTHLKKQQDVTVEPQKKLFGIIKGDNLFLATLITSVVCLGCLLLIMTKEEADSEKIAQEMEERRNPRSREVPIGKFEHLNREIGSQGLVEIVQFDASVSLAGTSSHLDHHERQIYQSQNRIKAAVETAVREANESDLLEPDLSNLRKSIKYRIQEATKQDNISEVFFGNFISMKISETY